MITSTGKEKKSGDIETDIFKNDQAEEFSAILTRGAQVKGIIYSKLLTEGLKSNDKSIRKVLEENKFKLELINELAGPDKLSPRPIYVRGNIVCEYRVYRGGQMIYLQLYDSKSMNINPPL